MVFLVFYVDDKLLIGNNIPTLKSVKFWLTKCFSIKDLGEADYILVIRIYINRSKHFEKYSKYKILRKGIYPCNMTSE